MVGCAPLSVTIVLLSKALLSDQTKLSMILSLLHLLFLDKRAFCSGKRVFFVADLDDCCKVLTMEMKTKMPSCSQKDDVEPCGEEKCRFTIDRTTKVTIVMS